ncbi:MAG: ThuA domain-containing protein [Bryobacterales bacterium]|nr:ThuA domain-containing protein [Bryobacterales bacterium]
MRTARIGILLFGLALAIFGATREKPLRVLLVTGGHSYDPAFHEIFTEWKDLDITVAPHPSAFREDMRSRYDLLLLYDLADVEDEAKKANLRNFVDAGRGIVALHHAIADNQNWPWWQEDVIGGLYLLKPRDGKPASTYEHDLDMDIQPVAKHPVTAGIDAFRINDEAYKQMWISPRNLVLLRTNHPQSDGPVAWIGPNRQSRVVYIQLGHGPLAYRNPSYRKLVRQAILWAAGRQ